MIDKFKIRKAEPAHQKAIADLHTLSWRTHYRGVCSDEYLDDFIFEERQKVWRERFESHDPDMLILVAENEENELVGFVCTFLNHHEKYGAYLDNLHVDPDCHGMGLGKQLMQRTATVINNEKRDEQIYLHVLKENEGAIKFYERIGGKRIAEYEDDMPWGGKGIIIDYLWDIDQLIEESNLND